MKSRILVAVCALVVWLVTAGVAGAGTEGYVWWEGEAAVKTNFPKQCGLSKSTLGKKADLLSEGDWLCSDGKRTTAEPLSAMYNVNVPSGGAYHFWARKFWKHGPFEYRFDSQAWQTCAADVALADGVSLAQFISANWVALADVDLKAGAHTFELRLLAKEGEAATAAFDCFLLTQGAFVPNGKTKPGEKSGLAEPGHFAFEPGLDPFRDSPIDLRYLNEEAAGGRGALRRDGADFVLGDGKPVKFWAVNVGMDNAGQSHEAVDYMARRLAKLGVNMVRFHANMVDTNKIPAVIDLAKLDKLQYMVEALKKHGIYTYISVYFPLWFDAEKNLGMTGYAKLKSKNPFGLLFFDPDFQAMYRGWVKTILTTKNPYGKTPLGQDPAVGIVEIQNEDSLFFWTFAEGNIPADKFYELEELYSKTLAAKYGSVEAAFAAWGKEAGDPKHVHDDAAKHHAGLFEAWHMTAAGFAKNPAKQRRVGDQVEFLANLQKSFYADTVKYLKSDLHYTGLVNACNWKAADERLLDAVERWSYTAGDMIDRHGYFSGRHSGTASGWSVAVGQSFESKAAVTVPDAMPFNTNAVQGFPSIISEIGFTQPNRFRADATFLTAGWSSLQGINGVYFFALGSDFLIDSSISKFQLGSPAMAYTFPATALLFRREDVATGKPAVVDGLNMADLFALRGSATVAPLAIDALRAHQGETAASAGHPTVMFDPCTFAVGPVTRTYSTKAPKDLLQTAMNANINRQAATVFSNTGELSWNYLPGLAIINTPRAQGFAGFLSKAGMPTTELLTLASQNEFSSILVISLDGLALKDSRKMLIQAMTEEQPYGFKADSKTGMIADVGTGPFGVRKISSTLTMKVAGASSVRFQPLDENGYPMTSPITSSVKGDSITFTLPPTALYTVLTR